MLTRACANQLDEIADLLLASNRILFITGAGVSADSGLPTYRGIGGLYEDDLTDEGIPIEEALSGGMLRRRPEITWKYLAQIERNCRNAGPNGAHLGIARLEQLLPYVLVLTQNVDGLHRAAGSRNLVEIHGDVHRLQCLACEVREEVPSLAGRSLPPVCAVCGAPMRPEVVLFGEMLPESALAHYMDALETGFDLVFSIGTTSIFPYIAQPVVQAIQAGIPTVEINPGQTCLSPYVDFQLPLGAAGAIAALLERCERKGVGVPAGASLE